MGASPGVFTRFLGLLLLDRTFTHIAYVSLLFLRLFSNQTHDIVGELRNGRTWVEVKLGQVRVNTEKLRQSGPFRALAEARSSAEMSFPTAEKSRIVGEKPLYIYRNDVVGSLYNIRFHGRNPEWLYIFI